MSRYIDADALKKALCKVCGMRHYCKSHDEDCWAKRRIDEQPTVDAVPVEWIREFADRLRFNGFADFAAIMDGMLKSYCADVERKDGEV